MKKLIILAATTALIASGCGKKDKSNVDSAVDNTKAAAESVKNSASDAAAKVEKTADSAKDAGQEAYGSGTKDGGSDAALGSADRKFLVESCEAEGQSNEACECSVKAMEDGLSSETMKVMLKSARLAETDGDAAGEEYMLSNLGPDNQAEFFAVMPALMACDPSMLEKLQQQ